MREPACVGAFIRDSADRVFVQRRTPQRRVLPGIWDTVGGHIEAGETPEETLAREIHEETGWTLRRIEARIADWEWEWDGVIRREWDYLVEVDGDLSAPALEEGKQDRYDWVGLADLELLMEGRTDGDRRLRDVVAKAARIRLTERLRLEPIGPEHAADLRRLRGGTAAAARSAAERMGAEWERSGVAPWMAYERGTDALIGCGGLSRVELDGAEQLAARWTVPGGPGHAGEIGRAAIDFGFTALGAAQVIALVDRDSRAVAERLGMTYRRVSGTSALYTVDRG